MQVVILAGGYGTRLAEKTDTIPKPLVEIGGKPIVKHIIDIYSHQGYTDFIVATGYKGQKMKEYFRDFMQLNGDIQFDFSRNQALKLPSKTNKDANIKVSVVDTGLETMTGSRLKRLDPYLGEEFMLTYGDGLGNINLKKLIEFHKEKDALITITSIVPTSRYGSILQEDGYIKKFKEKPTFKKELVNAGFMVIRKDFLNLIDNDDSILIEEQPFERAIKMGKMATYIHNGFWHPMDTLRDQKKLDKLAFKAVPEWMKIN